MGGCLQPCWRQWKSDDPWTQQVVRHGYALPIVADPPLSSTPIAFPSYQKGTERHAALHEEVSQMIAKHAVEPVPLPSLGYYSLLFVVPKATGGWRPIIDLSPLNHFVDKCKFTMETPATVLKFLRQGDWMVSLDLKDAYFQIPIHPRSRHLLRFVWEGRSWQFRALCFGLTSAPYVFTRVMAAVSARAHARGVRLVRYLDDWLMACDNRDHLIQHRDWLLALCLEMGIRVNFSKSELTPSKTKCYLGMDLDTVSATVRPSQKRLDRLASTLREFRRLDSPSALLWLRLLGHMTSIEKYTTEGRSRMRSLQFCLSDAWSSEEPLFRPVRVNLAVRRDLLWWEDLRSLTQGVPIHAPTPDVSVFTDASMAGWGAHLADLQASGLWTPEETLLHINLLELEAVRRGLQAFRSHLIGLCVQVMSDNTTVVSYISKQGGTRSRSLCRDTLALLHWARQHRIRLSARFLPGNRNVLADQLSRRGQTIASEWCLHLDVCREIWRTWGCPHVDMFATKQTRRLPLYVSALPDSNALATDALSISWDRMTIYAFPPFALIRLVVNKIRASQHLSVILIAPWWPAREWFPDLLELCTDHPRKLPLWRVLLKQPHQHRFHEGLESLNLHAWMLSSEPSEGKVFRSRLPVGLPAQLGNPPPTSTTPNGQCLSAGWCKERLIDTRFLYQ